MDVSPVVLTALRAKVDLAGLDNVAVVEAGFLTTSTRADAQRASVNRLLDLARPELAGT